jgi:Mg-chelatase subunit ChlI/Mg-chelatase subunit ChlD
MKHFHFPFTAILGQENMIEALILNVIDPKIGGVLLTGQQGTGKSTAVRSLVDLLPHITINEGCQFQCNLDDQENLCEYCRSHPHSPISKPINLVNLPLGATEDMVLGSLDIEKIIREGKRTIQPGLLAKAHRGLLYVDEINLLQDHLVDILLDVSASGINLIEREGISLSHPSRFILVGSMNPEEGELRPQISDRLGLEVPIFAPKDPKMRAEITKRVIEFNDNPEQYLKKYEKYQNDLKAAIEKAIELISKIQIPPHIYKLASELVLKLNLYSQRADITFIRCARAHAALRGCLNVEKIDLDKALHLVFEHRIKRFNENIDAQFLGNTFDEIYSKIEEGGEDMGAFEPTEKEMMNIFKYTPDVKDKYKENPLNQENQDIPEVEQGHKPSQDKYSNFNSNDEIQTGYKVGDTNYKRIYADPIEFQPFVISDKPLKMDIKPILDFLNTRMRVSNYIGRGSRVRVLTRSMGSYIYAKKPKGLPRNIAFDASIKNHYLNQIPKLSGKFPHQSDIYESNCLNPKPKLAVPLSIDDLKEKMFEVKAPLTLFFIVDASNSMVKTLDQTIKVIQSVHSEGYKKKDKISVISFQARESRILQRPSVSFSVGFQKLKALEATSYTPMASALRKTLIMINQEKIKGTNIPVVFILSDLGANVSEKYPELSAQSNEDFSLIEQEIDEIAQEIGKKSIKVVIMKPKKIGATKFLGVNPHSVEKIQESFLLKAKARLFEFDAYDPENTIIQLKQLLS